MLAEHRAAFTALAWGGLTILILFSPLFIYMGEYSEKEKAKNIPDSGDFLTMVSQALALHVAIAFFAIVAISSVDIVFSAIPEMQPGEGIKNFYRIGAGSGADSEFIYKWMRDPTSLPTTAAPLTEISKNAFIGAQMVAGLAMTVLFMVIPMVITVLSIKHMLSSTKQGVGSSTKEMDLENIIGGVQFFIGAIVLLGIHFMIASAVVQVAIGSTSFSFFEAMQKIWEYALSGLPSTMA